MKTQVSMKTYFGTVLALLILLLASVAFVRSAGESGIESHSFIKGYTYIVEDAGATFKAFNGLTGALASEDASDDVVIQYAIDQTTSSGGSVLVKSASYSASVTLKDNVTLWLEHGVSGITVTIDSGADCVLVDEENGFRKEYVSGNLYSFMDYRSSEFWYSGENRTDLIANPTNTASYIVETDGTYTWMTNCSTGQRDWTSSDSSAVINACVNNFSYTDDRAGKIFLKYATYNIDTTITIGKRTHLIAEVGTLLNVTANINAITINSTSLTGQTNWKISGFTINMNDMNGNAIYSAHAYGSENQLAEISNLQVSNVKTGYADINITNPCFMHVKDVRLKTDGTGIYLRMDSSYSLHLGNSMLENVFIKLEAANAVGIHYQADEEVGASFNSTINLISAHHIDIQNPSNYTGTVGVKMRGARTNTFYTLNIEYPGIGIDIAPNGTMQSVYNNFYHTNIYMAHTSAVKLSDGSYANNFEGGSMECNEASDFIIDDDNSLATSKNRFRGFRFGSGTFDLLSGSDIDDSHNANGFIGLYHSLTSIAVNNGTWVAHLMAGKPKAVYTSILSDYAQDFTIDIYFIDSSSNSTHFQLAVLEADKTVPASDVWIRWSAYYQP